MDVTAALLESWDRQCRILDAVTSQVDDTTRHLKPSEDGWPLDHQLAHIHQVRRFWLHNAAPAAAEGLASTFTDGWETPIADLAAIKASLQQSHRAIWDAMAAMLEANDQKVGGYDHPVLYLQHMIWHEGWHVGLILLALRLAGHEPAEMWQETNIWGHWRTEEF